MSDPSTPSVPTVEISAPLYDTALKECNEVRALLGKEPIDALPPGVAGNPDSCPCGKATGAGACWGSWDGPFGSPVKDRRHGLNSFIREFDNKARYMGEVLPVRAGSPS